MDREALDYLRGELEAERISMGELALIESVFDTIPDEVLRDRRENAMASDMLDEIAAHALTY
jgi:hypothetical protein